MKTLKPILYGAMGAIGGLLMAGLVMVFAIIAALLALDAIRHPSWPELPGLPTFTTIGRLMFLLVGVAVAVGLWRVLGRVQAWSELRRERREFARFERLRDRFDPDWAERDAEHRAEVAAAQQEGERLREQLRTVEARSWELAERLDRWDPPAEIEWSDVRSTKDGMMFVDGARPNPAAEPSERIKFLLEEVERLRGEQTPHGTRP